jgi:hypothetical protein
LIAPKKNKNNPGPRLWRLLFRNSFPRVAD